jgi:hypothetical protein
MSLAEPGSRLQLPQQLQDQLHNFRRRVWTIKTIEAACGALFGVLVAFLAVFTLDRLIDTSTLVRSVIFTAAVLVCATVPVALHRWIWCNRRLEQLAQLLSRKFPYVGDQLLGIIELVRSESEQARSRALCEAAIRQVSEEAGKKDFQTAVPHPRHRLWATLAAIPAIAVVALLAIFPAAATNAWARFVLPWNDTPRYTFTSVDSLPKNLVVAHGEPVTVSVALHETTKWRPEQGSVTLGNQPPITTSLDENQYKFELPAQIDSSRLNLHIGDAIQNVKLEPKLRPELTGVTAEIGLPAYLQRPDPLTKDVRGGSVSVVKGSNATFKAVANRPLVAAQIDKAAVSPAGDSISSDKTVVNVSRKLEFRWEDENGLAGKEPFVLSVTARDDESPSLSCEDLPRQKVVLDSEVLNFKVKAQDDFGVKRVGIEWQGISKTAVVTPAKGERVLAAGGADQESLDLAGTFSAKKLGIEPQPISLRLFVEDYLPGRERIYSPAYTLYILNAEQHSIWITEELSKWHRQSLEVRDREMQLHQANKELRAKTPEELNAPETRKRIENQATAERANGRRLTGLVGSGEELVRQAMRNPEFGVGHLDKWAEMLQILKDISGTRMPNVADLLKEASKAPSLAQNQSQKSPPTVGNIRDLKSGPPKASDPSAQKPKPVVPGIVDIESSQQLADKNAKPADANEKKKPSAPRLTLPVTTLIGKAPAEKKDAPKEEEKLDEAIVAQKDLLAEFEKIAEELNEILANLEGSTLVKRLKAQSRTQDRVAVKMGKQIGDAFGKGELAAKVKPQAEVIETLATQEATSSHDVSLIMDDMHAYFERRQFLQFKTVLEDMKKLDAVGSIRQLGDDLKKEHGLSIAQAEFWSDTLDRWAEDLVDPSKCGKCKGCKSKGSLPPSIVLEVLQVLEAEMNLREETRVTQQAKAAIEAKMHEEQANKLSGSQKELQVRIEKVSQLIREIPEGESDFAKELALLEKVTKVMHETVGILAQPETGAPAIAAETEIIELLLATKRIKPGSGGGGGSTPGGGGGGTTQDYALALVGSGVNEKEVREDHGVSQSSGESGPVLPEEFRAGLDEYFNKLERAPTKK